MSFLILLSEWYFPMFFNPDNSNSVYVFIGVTPRSHGLSPFLSLGNGPMTPALNAALPGAECGAALRWILQWIGLRGRLMEIGLDAEDGTPSEWQTDRQLFEKTYRQTDGPGMEWLLEGLGCWIFMIPTLPNSLHNVLIVFGYDESLIRCVFSLIACVGVVSVLIGFSLPL